MTRRVILPCDLPTSVMCSLAVLAAPFTRTVRYRALPTLTTRAVARVIVLAAALGAVLAVGTGAETATGAAVTTGAVGAALLLLPPVLPVAPPPGAPGGGGVVPPHAAPLVGLKSVERKMPSPPLRVPTFSDTTSMQLPVVLRTKIPASPLAFVQTSTKSSDAPFCDF